MLKLFLCAGGLLAAAGVAAGSFGAHGLKAWLDATGRADNWETAVRYCLTHALAIMVIAVASGLPQAAAAQGRLAAAGWCFLLGTLVFSGCLAALALTGVRVLGAIVPIGGVLFLVGWACVVAAALAVRSAD
ncbi:MAG: DUF423 domain-containing protein [Planctomycetia bacterium]|nr:DUF423 domain-containing protein [Planctomycetia bacterium]